MAATSKEAAGVAAAVGGASGSAAATAAGEKDSEMKKARETVAAMPEEIAFEALEHFRRNRKTLEWCKKTLPMVHRYLERVCKGIIDGVNDHQPLRDALKKNFSSKLHPGSKAMVLTRRGGDDSEAEWEPCTVTSIREVEVDITITEDGADVQNVKKHALYPLWDPKKPLSNTIPGVYDETFLIRELGVLLLDVHNYVVDVDT
eukprot:3232138-Rhodomonas_salina.1